MEFKFNVNDVFKEPIVEINHNLLPTGFNGDRRTLCNTMAKVTEVVNAMGDASATAQGLPKPITTAERLRNSNQTIYLMVDKDAKDGKGAITGMLKTGKKGLYVFDRDGHHYQVSPPCILDFYVDKSKQRQGVGRQLFQHMLERQELHPAKVAIDRPSDKMLSFMNKHYGLSTPVQQMNNYVVFDGFFPEKTRQANATATPRKRQSANGLQPNYASPYGRFGAPRPPTSMAQIISQNKEPTGNKDSFNPASYRSNFTIPKPLPNYSDNAARNAFSAPNVSNQVGQYQEGNYPTNVQSMTQFPQQSPMMAGNPAHMQPYYTQSQPMIAQNQMNYTNQLAQPQPIQQNQVGQGAAAAVNYQQPHLHNCAQFNAQTQQQFAPYQYNAVASAPQQTYQYQSHNNSLGMQNNQQVNAQNTQNIHQPNASGDMSPQSQANKQYAISEPNTNGYSVANVPNNTPQSNPIHYQQMQANYNPVNIENVPQFANQPQVPYVPQQPNVVQQPYQQLHNNYNAVVNKQGNETVMHNQAHRPNASGDMPPVPPSNREFDAADPNITGTTDISFNPSQPANKITDEASTQEYPPQIRTKKVQNSLLPFPNPISDIYVIENGGDTE